MSRFREYMEAEPKPPPCAECGSKNTEVIEKKGIRKLKCNDCGDDNKSYPRIVTVKTEDDPDKKFDPDEDDHFKYYKSIKNAQKIQKKGFKNE